jgi:hypothetical protein
LTTLLEKAIVNSNYIMKDVEGKLTMDRRDREPGRMETWSGQWLEMVPESPL